MELVITALHSPASTAPNFALPSVSQRRLISFFLLLLLLMSTSAADGTRVKRNTLSGPIIGVVRRPEGLDSSSAAVEYYLGIPYAEPPVGKLRFQKPVEVKPWTQEKMLDKLGPSCWQYLPTKQDLSNPSAAVWLNNTEMSEDCLHVNVWVPQGGTKRKAMMVWIFGGGFFSGSANLEVYNGEYLAAKYNIIVANINYRVGPFGFLYLGAGKGGSGGAGMGNVGLWDQNLALSWLYRNADAFGANPDTITLMGESAGSASVSMHLLSPHSHRFFSRAILQSGTFLVPWVFSAPELAHRRGINLAWAVGCLSSSDIKAAYTSNDWNQRIVDCLRGLTPMQIVNAIGDANKDELKWREDALRRFPDRRPAANAPPAWLLAAINFVPVVEPNFFPVSPQEAERRQTLKPASLLLGTNADEGTYFLFYFMPPFSTLLYSPNMKSFASITQTILTGDPADYISDYLLPLNYLYPEVLDQILLTYSAPSRQLFPAEFAKTNKTRWVDVLSDLTGDFNFKCPTLTLADWYSGMGEKVYVYSFEHRTQSLTFPKWTGTMHGYELDYTFGTPFNPRYQKKFYRFTEPEKRLSSKMMQRWANFVKTGDPNNDGRTMQTPKWPTYNMKTESVMRFCADTDADIGVTTNKKRQHCQLWMKVIPRLVTTLENGTCQRSTSNAYGLQSQPFLILVAVIGSWIMTLSGSLQTLVLTLSAP